MSVAVAGAADIVVPAVVIVPHIERPGDTGHPDARVGPDRDVARPEGNGRARDHAIDEDRTDGIGVEAARRCDIAQGHEAGCGEPRVGGGQVEDRELFAGAVEIGETGDVGLGDGELDRKSTRLNSSNYCACSMPTYA